jgi:hypothetical protein
MSEVHTFCNGVIPFVWDRLPLDKAHKPASGKPCLAEDWFAEDAIAMGSPFIWRGRPPEESHRLLYRYAKDENMKRLEEKGEYIRNPEWLLLHQMAELVPALLMVAQAGISEAALKGEG